MYCFRFILRLRTWKMLVIKVFLYALTFLCVATEDENNNPVFAMVHKTLVATARSCMVKVNGTEADLEYLRNDPPYPEKSSCILTCLLEKISIVSNNKYSKTGFMTSVMPLVFRNTKKLQHMKTVSENCDTEVNSQHVNPCMLGNEITTCIFKYAPELQFNKRGH